MRSLSKANSVLSKVISALSEAISVLAEAGAAHLASAVCLS